MASSCGGKIVGLVRLAVTAAGIGWVLLQIEWQDHVRLADGTLLVGRIDPLPDRFAVLTPEGVYREVPRSRTAAGAAFQPGFLTLFRDMDPLYLALGLGVYPMAIVLGAVRWRGLMRAHRMDPGLGGSVRLTWIGFFWSLVFPGVTGGDLVKACCVARVAERRAVSVMTVVLDRVIGIVGLAVLSGIVILFNLRNEELRGVSAGVLAFILAVVAGGVLFFSRRLRRWLGINWLLGRLPFQAHVHQLDDALFEYRHHMGSLAGALALSLAGHVANVGVFCLAGASLGLPIAWHHYFVFVPVVLMIAALPVSIGGLGVLEGGMVHFLTLSGVGATLAGVFALCLLYRVMTILVALPGALMRPGGAALEGAAQSGEPAETPVVRGGGRGKGSTARRPVGRGVDESPTPAKSPELEVLSGV